MKNEELVFTKIICMELSTGKVRKFSTLEEASAHYRIGVDRIKWCINTGRRWRTLTFDIA